MLSNITRTEIVMIAGPMVLFLFVLEMVRRRLLREDYSLLWLVTFGALFTLSIFRDSLLFRVSDLLGVFYPPTALFVIGFALMLLTLLQFSVVISKLARENKQAGQHIALLSTRVCELERQLEAQENG